MIRSDPGRRVRVVHIVTRFLDGGSERRLLVTASALAGLGWHNDLIVGRDAIVPTDPSIDDVTMLRSLIRQPHPLRDAQAIFGLVLHLRRSQYDIVITYQSKAGIVGRVAARLARTPLVVHSLVMTNVGPAFGRLSPAYVLVERLVGRWTDAFLVVGADLEASYLRRGIGRKEQFHVLRSPIDLGGVARALDRGRSACRRDLGAGEGDHVVAFVGSLSERKGLADLPAFLVTLREMLGEPIHLVVAGSGPMAQWLDDALSRIDGVSARLLGHVDDVGAVVVAADCLVSLSRAEGLSQVLVMAAAAGTPFVSYQVDGPAELLELGAVGRVTPPSDVAAAASAAAELLSRERPAPLKAEAWEPSAVQSAFRSTIRRLWLGVPRHA